MSRDQSHPTIYWPWSCTIALALLIGLALLAQISLRDLRTKIRSDSDNILSPPEHFLIRGRLHNEKTTFSQKVGEYCFTFTWQDAQSTMVTRVPCETIKN